MGGMPGGLAGGMAGGMTAGLAGCIPLAAGTGGLLPGALVNSTVNAGGGGLGGGALSSGGPMGACGGGMAACGALGGGAMVNNALGAAGLGMAGGGMPAVSCGPGMGSSTSLSRGMHMSMSAGMAASMGQGQGYPPGRQQGGYGGGQQAPQGGYPPALGASVGSFSNTCTLPHIPALTGAAPGFGGGGGGSMGGALDPSCCQMGSGSMAGGSHHCQGPAFRGKGQRVGQGTFQYSGGDGAAPGEPGGQSLSAGLASAMPTAWSGAAGRRRPASAGGSAVGASFSARLHGCVCTLRRNPLRRPT